jgi:hypothetical protein
MTTKTPSCGETNRSETGETAGAHRPSNRFPHSEVGRDPTLRIYASGLLHLSGWLLVSA